jgi:O-antigen ligase
VAIKWWLPCLVAVVPLLMIPGLAFHYDSLPKVAVLVLAMAFALFFRSSVAEDVALIRRTRTGRWLCMLAAIQVAWSAIATAGSTRVWFSLLGSNWRRFGLITILALAVFVILTTAHLLKYASGTVALLRAMTVPTVVISLYAIAQYFNFDPLQSTAGYQAQDGDFTIIRPPGTLGHADYLGWWLAIAVFCNWALSRMERGAWRAAATAGTVLSLIAIVMSGTRSAILGVAVGFLYIAVTSRERPRPTQVLFAVVTLAAAVTFYQSAAGERLRARVRWSSDETPGGARPLLWRDTLRMAVAHPLLGFGPETFAAEFPPYQSLELARLVPDFYHESPHNLALDVLTSEGIPGLLIALGWAGLGFVAIAEVHRRREALDVALAAAFISSCVVSLFNVSTIGPAVATLTLLAMLVTRTKDTVTAAAAPASRVLFRFAALPVAAALATYGIVLLVSDFELARFSRTASANDPHVTVGAYRALRSPGFLPAGSPGEDLYCSRILAGVCGKGADAIARLSCSQVATQAAARATTTADNPPNAWYNLAMFAAAHNDGRGTEMALRSAVHLAPNWFRPHLALARLLDLSGRKNEAVIEIRTAALLGAGKNQDVTDSVKVIAEAR